MPIILVEVMPKAELLDPQGKAVTGVLTRRGTARFSGVRIGKRFELTLDGPADDAALDEAREIAETVLSNSVIEDVVSVRFAESEELAVPEPVDPVGVVGAELVDREEAVATSVETVGENSATSPAGASA